MRWHAVDAEAADAVGRLLAACRGAMRGGLMVSVQDGSGARRSVMTDRASLHRWDPATAELPDPVAGEWSDELRTGDRRTAFVADARALMRRAKDEGLLTLAQAASIAHAIALALDGAGPFSKARTGG